MSLIPQQIRERIYKGWHFIVTITTPMVCVYALYDIKEILFSTKRIERYSKKSPESNQSKPVDTVAGNKSTKKETPTSDEKNAPKPKEKRTFKTKKKTKKGITMSTVNQFVDLVSDIVGGMFAKPTDSKNINLKTTGLATDASKKTDNIETGVATGALKKTDDIETCVATGALKKTDDIETCLATGALKKTDDIETGLDTGALKKTDDIETGLDTGALKKTDDIETGLDTGALKKTDDIETGLNTGALKKTDDIETGLDTGALKKTDDIKTGLDTGALKKTDDTKTGLDTGALKKTDDIKTDTMTMVYLQEEEMDCIQKTLMTQSCMQEALMTPSCLQEALMTQSCMQEVQHTSEDSLFDFTSNPGLFSVRGKMAGSLKEPVQRTFFKIGKKNRNISARRGRKCFKQSANDEEPEQTTFFKIRKRNRNISVKRGRKGFKQSANDEEPEQTTFFKIRKRNRNISVRRGRKGFKQSANDEDRDDIDNIITARPPKGSTEMDEKDTYRDDFDNITLESVTMLYRRMDRDDIENIDTANEQMYWREEGISVYALEGGHIKLGRAVHISTKAKWTKNNKPIESKHSELDLYSLSVADEGFYVCEFGPYNLQLKYWLFVLENEETVCTEKNRIVFLGIPKQDVDSLIWTKDGEVIESTYPSQTWLTVPIKSLDDAGLYVCTFGTNHMQLKYRLVVVDQMNEDPRNQMTVLGCFGWKVRHTWLEEFAITQRNVKKLTIRCEGRFEEEKSIEITLGPKGLMLQCHIFLPKPIEQVTMFRYENEKYKEDEYIHYYTQVGYIRKPEQSYIIVRLLKKSRISES